MALPTSVIKLTSNLSEAVDKANLMAASTGLSVETVGALDYALQGAGTSVDEFSTGLRSMAARLEQSPQYFEDLGIEIHGVDGGLRDMDSILRDSVRALASIESSLSISR